MASFIDTLFGTGGNSSHPKDVAKAYYELNRQLARDEGTYEEQQWRSLFDQAKDSGMSPADLHNPISGNTVTPDRQSALDRWKNQIDGLIQSGNPVLQKEGLSMLAQYKMKSLEAPTEPKRSSSAQIAMDLGLTPGTPEFKEFVRNHAMKSGSNKTEIIMGSGGKEGTRLTKEEMAEFGLPEGTYVHTKQGPKPVSASPYTEAQSKDAYFATMMDQSNQTISALMGSGFDPTQFNQKVGDYAEGLSGYVLSPSQQVYKQAADQWLRAKIRPESGAEIPAHEMAQEYRVFFPQPNEGRAVIAAKEQARALVTQALASKSGGKYQRQVFKAAENIVKMAMEEDKTWSGPGAGINNVGDKIKQSVKDIDLSTINFTPEE